MTSLSHRASAWLPEGAAQYAADLIGLKGKEHVRQICSAQVGEITFNNELSKRLLLNLEMKEVWNYLSKTHDEHEWFRFLSVVQRAAIGPGLIDRRSPNEKIQDLDDLRVSFREIERISKRYGIDVAKNPVGSFFDVLGLEWLLDEPDGSYAVRGGNGVTFKEYFDALRNRISSQQMLIKKPGHKDILYQYFVRFVYQYFQQFTDQPNQWKIQSIIASVSLEKDISSSRVKGTCQDLK